MNEEQRKGKSKKISARLDFSSRFWKTFLVVLAAFLTFAGPTYVPYALINILEMNYFISIGLGFALLIVGLLLVWYLIKSKAIS